MAKEKIKKAAVHESEISTTELASIVGKTTSWIRQLTRDGILKQSGRGKYILADAMQAYIEHASGGKEEDNRPRLRDEQAELTRIRKEDAMLDLAVKRGELHKADDVRSVVTDMLLNFRSRIMALPTMIAPKVAYLKEIPKIAAVLDEELRIALTTLADYKPEDYKEGVGVEREHTEDA